MNEFEILRDTDRLVLQLPEGNERLLRLGCPLACFATICLLILGILSILHEEFASVLVAADQPHFLDPRVNHFGILWGVGFAFLITFVPLYIIYAPRSALVFSFDRWTGRFSRNHKDICALNRIEQVRIRRMCDETGIHSLRLVIIYHDGHEILIHESENEEEIHRLAKEIADFIAVSVIGR
jgi:hypothetical protein